MKNHYSNSQVNKRSGLSIQAKAIFLFPLFITLTLFSNPAFADFLDEVGSVGEEQIKEKKYLKKMKNEINQVNSEIGGALDELKNLNKQLQNRKNAGVTEVHLFARNTLQNTRSNEKINCLSYNGKVPGPVIRVRQGDRVKVVLHNNLNHDTSLYFHGLRAPHEVNGLPRKGNGIVPKGESFVYQFIAKDTGTYWYHPQVIHAKQRLKGLYGILIVEPKLRSRPYDKDVTLLFSKMSYKPIEKRVKVPKTTKFLKSVKNYAVAPRASKNEDLKVSYLVNGKQAPSIPAIELRKGDRVKLRMVNASDEIIPIHLSGHTLELINLNGGDKLEPHVFRDSITLQPSDRIEAEFMANNPGVWSLASEVFLQASSNGDFPGGIACVVRYSELKARQRN